MPAEMWTRRAATRAQGRQRAAAIRTAAPIVLRETENPAVMWGDCGLLDEIAERADKAMLKIHPLLRHQIILDALRTSAELVPGTAIVGRARRVRIFYLPERVPDWPR